MATQTEKIEKIVEIRVTGEAEIRQLERAAERMNGTIRRINASSQGFAAANDNVARSSKQASLAMQNAGYQVGDFLVQVQGGTDWLRAFGQQFPQLVQGFGAVGAGIGVAVVALTAFAPVLQSLLGQTRPVAEQIEKLKDSLDDFGAIADELARPLTDLRTEFGQLAPLMADVNREAQQMQFRGFESSMRELIGSVANFGDFLQDLDRQALRSFRVQTGLAKEELDALGISFNSLDSADTFEEMARAAAEMRVELRSVADEASITDGAFTKVDQNLTEIVKLASRLAATTGEVEVEANAAQRQIAQWESSIDAASEAMSRLSGIIAGIQVTNIGLAAQNAALEAGQTVEMARAAGQIAEERSKLEAALSSDDWVVRENANRQLQDFTERTKRQVELATANAALIKTIRDSEKSAAGGGGRSKLSDAAKEAEKAARDAAREFEQFERRIASMGTEAEKTQARIDELSAGLERWGEKLSPEQIEMATAAIIRLEKELSGSAAVMAEVSSSFESSLSSSLQGVITRTESVGEAFGNMLLKITSDIAAFLIQTQVMQFLQLLGGTAFGQGFGNVLAGAVASPAPARFAQAANTPVAAPASVVRNITTPVSAGHMGPAAMRAPGGGVNINVNNNAGAQVAAQATPTADGLNIDVMVERSMQRAIGNGALDRAAYTSWGVTRKTT